VFKLNRELRRFDLNNVDILNSVIYILQTTENESLSESPSFTTIAIYGKR